MKKNLESFCKNYIIKEEHDDLSQKFSNGQSILDKKKRKKKRKKEILCARCQQIVNQENSINFIGDN